MCFIIRPCVQTDLLNLVYLDYCKNKGYFFELFLYFYGSVVQNKLVIKERTMKYISFILMIMKPQINTIEQH